jgi:hypothetical protein
MKKERFGFAAFDKASGKGLNVVFNFITVTYLTDDPDKVYIADDYKSIDMYTRWFNESHKNQKEFIIQEVVITTEIKPRWNIPEKNNVNN